MPKKRIDNIPIDKFYQNVGLGQVVFGWVKGQRQINPNLTVVQSLVNLEEMLGNRNNFAVDTLESIYYEMQSLYHHHK